LAYKALTAAAFGTWHSTPNSRGKLNNKFTKGKKKNEYATTNSGTKLGSGHTTMSPNSIFGGSLYLTNCHWHINYEVIDKVASGIIKLESVSLNLNKNYIFIYQIYF